MECFNNWIGIRGCGAPSSDEVEAVPANPDADPPTEEVEAVPALPILFVNDLPGVTLENLNALVSDEQQTYVQMWAVVSKRALLKFYLIAKAELNKCHKITDKETVECLLCENVELLVVALWYFMGVELMIERTSTDNLNRFTTIDLDKAERLKGEFYAEATSALTDAIKGIDVCNSDCIEDDVCVQSNETYKHVYANL